MTTKHEIRYEANVSGPVVMRHEVNRTTGQPLRTTCVAAYSSPRVATDVAAKLNQWAYAEED
jgi:hypothetical protein